MALVQIVDEALLVEIVLFEGVFTCFCFGFTVHVVRGFCLLGDFSFYIFW